MESIFRLDLLLSSEIVGSVAILAAKCCEARIDDVDVSRRLYLATFELIENAAKYASSPFATIDLSLERRDGEEPLLTLSVRNAAHIERLDEIRRRFRDLRPPANPIHHYDRLIVEAAPKPSGLSGLGLARVRAEGGFDLDCVVDEETLTISARSCVALGSIRPIPGHREHGQTGSLRAPADHVRETRR